MSGVRTLRSASCWLCAVREGVLRRHMLVHDGHIRDSVMYSIQDSEWTAVKARIEGFLAW
jgi:hypothetical protein